MSRRGSRLLAGLVAVAALAVLPVIATQIAHAAGGPVVSCVVPPPVTLTGSVRPNTPYTPDTSPRPPGPPTDLTAVEVTATSVRLTWTASSNGAVGGAVEYDISYKPVSASTWSVLTVSRVTTATVTGLTPATEYQFVVRGRDSWPRVSAPSNEVIVTTRTAGSADTIPPSAPTGLVATDITTASVTLTWAPSTDNVGVTGYEVWGMVARCAPVRVTTVTTTAVALTLQPISGITGTTPYAFYVVARDAAGNVSAQSNTVSFVVSVSPTVSTSPSTPATTGSVLPSRTVVSDPVPCAVKYTRQSEWPGGFVAMVTIGNTGLAAVNTWTLSFGYPGDQRISSAWGATVVQSGPSVTARNVAWNAMLAPGATVSFGVQGTWLTSDAPPASFTLNGIGCAVG